MKEIANESALALGPEQRHSPLNSKASIPNTSSGQVEVFDAVVIGAGFAGLYALHRLRDQMGLSARVFDVASDVGGTWYWNRYPGARCDIESIHYSYSFSAELQQEWTWSERFSAQPEILRYLNHVADRFDLRKDIQFNTRITSLVWNEKNKFWEVGTNDGIIARGKYIIAGTGNLSVAKAPEFKGVENFKGEVYLTGNWPHEGVDFTGKRVGVIGAGASGIQAITEIAKEAAHLTVFQRTPNYATPIGNAPMDTESTRQTKDHYAEIRTKSRNSFLGVPYDQVLPSALAVSAEERRRVYAERYVQGGFRLFIDSFADLLFNKEANETAAEFVRAKIRERVKDPKVADMLTPKDYPYGTKRPPLETNYYETYNRDNVTLVDIKSTPIEMITNQGIRTTSGEYELDAIVLAIGFDAITGPLLQMGIVGRNGLKLEDKWANGPLTYLGIASHGFPNLFFITGPQSPSVLYNMPLAIEDHVDFATDAIRYLRDHDLDTIEPTLEAETQWVAHAYDLSQQTLMPGTDSWYMGANIPGKPRVCMLYLGGAPAYRKICADVEANGYEGFTLDRTVAKSIATTT
ncbi:MAG: NAD(P)/FAD-dependent oxidoreductase [Rugosibacter sp.]|nr:MAG: NAD(P)/FAD-dependent oxidoreductase [Rugosibacter sp.]